MVDSIFSAMHWQNQTRQMLFEQRLRYRRIFSNWKLCLPTFDSLKSEQTPFKFKANGIWMPAKPIANGRDSDLVESFEMRIITWSFWKLNWIQAPIKSTSSQFHTQNFVCFVGIHWRTPRNNSIIRTVKCSLEMIQLISPFHNKGFFSAKHLIRPPDLRRFGGLKML